MAIEPMMRGELARLDAVGAERGSDGALLDDRQVDRQRARTQLDGEIVGRLDREVARDLARAAEDRLADDRGRDHLHVARAVGQLAVVEHDRERRADVLLGELAELARARLVEPERDDGLVGALVEAGLGIDEVLADDDRRLLQEIAARPLERGVDPVARRNARLLRLLGRHTRMHGVEGQPRGLPDEVLQLARVLQPGELDEDTIAALAHDGRFGGAQVVDAPVHRLDRGRSRMPDALLQARARRPDQDEARLGGLDLDVGPGGAEDRVADRLGDLAQLPGAASVSSGRVSRAPGRRWAQGQSRRDLGIAQDLARIIAQRAEPVPAQLLGVHGEQQMRSALRSSRAAPAAWA